MSVAAAPTRVEKRARRRRLRRRWLVLFVVIAMAGLVAVDYLRASDDELAVGSQALYHDARKSPKATAAGEAPPTADLVDEPQQRDITPVVVERGAGTFTVAPGTGQRVGAGQTLTYQVQVEDGIGQEPAAFATVVDATLGDARSWIGSGSTAFQRVDTPNPSFTIYLASPATVDQLCAPLDTQGYTSCRVDDKVVINVARWQLAVPGYPASLDDYRSYVINHEVGHRLEHDHERCPGAGAPAPVMQQQTLGLDGCAPNAWPYLDGQFYRGPRDGSGS